MCIRDSLFPYYTPTLGGRQTIYGKIQRYTGDPPYPFNLTLSLIHIYPKRKTKYDLVTVHKQGLGWVNMDSQAPNKVVGAWLAKQGYDYIKSEFTYGKSRIDFYMEKGCLLYTSRCV